ncbi:hypothetical protein ACJJTC_003960 [Scirpophaga incertulas]
MGKLKLADPTFQSPGKIDLLLVFDEYCTLNKVPGESEGGTKKALFLTHIGARPIQLFAQRMLTILDFLNVLAKSGGLNQQHQGKTIHSEARTLILKVLTFFENEKANKRFMIPVDQAIKRACAATGVSKRTLMKIKNESKIVQQNDPPVPCTSVSGSVQKPIPKLSTPGKKRRTSAKKVELDNFDLCALRNIVNSFYIVRKEVPDLEKNIGGCEKGLKIFEVIIKK